MINLVIAKLLLLLSLYPSIIQSIEYTSGGQILVLQNAKAASFGDVLLASFKCKNFILTAEAPRLLSDIDTNICRLVRHERKYHHTLINDRDRKLSCTILGISADSQFLLDQIRSIMLDYSKTYSEQITIDSLADEISSLLHSVTMSDKYRPLSTQCCLYENNMKDNVLRIFKIECDGEYEEYDKCIIFPPDAILTSDNVPESLSTTTTSTTDDNISMKQLYDNCISTNWLHLDQIEAESRLRDIISNIKGNIRGQDILSNLHIQFI